MKTSCTALPSRIHPKWISPCDRSSTPWGAAWIAGFLDDPVPDELTEECELILQTGKRPLGSEAFDRPGNWCQPSFQPRRTGVGSKRVAPAYGGLQGHTSGRW